jgi:thymidylate synthase
MKQYLDVVRHVFEHGSWNGNRTKYRTLSVPGLHMRFDMNDGFPAVTTKKLAFKSAIAEAIGYLRAYTSAADFRALGTKTWDGNANDNVDWLASPYRSGVDDMGPAPYGVQWRKYPAFKMIDMSQPNAAAQVEDAKAKGYQVLTVLEEIGEDGKTYKTLLHKKVDQLRECLDKIISSPSDRRMIFHSWNVAQLDECALPSCPTFWQFSCDESTNELSLNLTSRSADLGLGVPFNCAQAAMMLHLVSRLTGYKPRWLSVMLGNAHIYENQIDMLQEQVKREPKPLPTLVINERVPDYALTGKYEPDWLDKVEPSDFSLSGYEHHGVLTAAMAV